MIRGENKNMTTVSKSGKEGPANLLTCISLFVSYFALKWSILQKKKPITLNYVDLFWDLYMNKNSWKGTCIWDE